MDLISVDGTSEPMLLAIMLCSLVSHLEVREQTLTKHVQKLLTYFELLAVRKIVTVSSKWVRERAHC